MLWLGGDFFSNTIHEDQAETNQLGPIDAAILVQDTIIGGLQYIKKQLPDLEIWVVCNSGNHGRITAKQRISSEAENSLERYMYHSIACMFVDDPQVKFTIESGYHTYVNLYGRLIRTHHGHRVRYYGGVGGLTVPLNKAIAGWNTARKVDLDLLGHFHMPFDGGNFVANGSLIGHSPYGIAIGAAYGPPRQMFLLFDSKHGKTVTAPILVEKP